MLILRIKTLPVQIWPDSFRLQVRAVRREFGHEVLAVLAGANFESILKICQFLKPLKMTTIPEVAGNRTLWCLLCHGIDEAHGGSLCHWRFQKKIIPIPFDLSYIKQKLEMLFGQKHEEVVPVKVGVVKPSILSLIVEQKEWNENTLCLSVDQCMLWEWLLEK